MPPDDRDTFDDDQFMRKIPPTVLVGIVVVMAILVPIWDRYRRLRRAIDAWRQ